MTNQDRDDFVLMKSDIDHTKKAIDKIELSVSNVNSTVTKMAQKLFKDDETGEEGYFQVIKSNRVRLTKLENIKVALIATIMAVGSGIGWVANNLLNK